MENCKHIRGDYWCYNCVSDIIEGKDRIIKNQNTINNELILKIGNPKHGYGVPPKEYERGIYFVRYKDTDHPKHKIGYWCVYEVTNDSWLWSQDIEEYFGPIPFEVWNAVKKEEEKTLPELYNIAREQLGKDFDSAGKTTLLNVKTFDLLKALSEQLDELKQTVEQVNAKPMPITKGAGMQ